MLKNRKIVYIANMRMPTERAEGVQVVKTCEALADLGVDVELVVPGRKSSIKADPFIYYRSKNNFRIKRLPTIDLVFLGKFGFVIHTAIYAFFCLFYLLRKDQAVIYSRDENILFFLQFLKNNIAWESHRGNINFFAKSVLKRISCLIVITQGLKERYSKYISQNKIVVVPDAVDVESFRSTINKKQAREKFGLPDDKKVVAYIGRLEDWKGYRTFLDASKKSNGDILFVVIGGTKREVELLSKIYPSVTFLGETPYGDLSDNQQIADVLVVPNSAKYDISKYYTSPLKVFAHMTSGVPIVASDLPSIREVLNEDNAYLVSPDNPKALLVGIRNVFSDEDLCHSISNKAKLDVIKYTWQNRAKSIAEAIGIQING